MVLDTAGLVFAPIANWGENSTMSIAEAPERRHLVARVRGLLLGPTAEWAVIRAESTTVRQLFVGYGCILAAIPTIAASMQLVFFSHITWPVVTVLAAVSYGLSLAAMFVQGAIFNAVAPSFGGEKNLVQAMKAAVYSQTAGCVASIVTIFPFLGFVFFFAGIYNLYILWLGLPRLMKVRADRAVGYVVLNLVLSFFVNLGVLVLTFVITRAVLTAAGVGGPGR